MESLRKSETGLLCQTEEKEPRMNADARGLKLNRREDLAPACGVANRVVPEVAGGLLRALRGEESLTKSPIGMLHRGARGVTQSLIHLSNSNRASYVQIPNKLRIK
jgi:hypothetical protein